MNFPPGVSNSSKSFAGETDAPVAGGAGTRYIGCGAGACGAGAGAGSSSGSLGLVCGISLAPFEFLRIDPVLNRYEGKTCYPYLSLQQVRCWRGIRRVVGQQTSCSDSIPNPKAELTAIAF